ncbi:DUF6660 family protein [Chitinophaga lutea]
MRYLFARLFQRCRFTARIRACYPIRTLRNCNNVIIIIAHRLAKCLTFVTVKYIAIILSIMILAFSGTVCSDELPGQPVEAGSCLMVDADAGMHQHAHADFCSPLCACGCCAAPVILSMAYCIPTQVSNTLLAYSDMPAGMISDIPQPVWQPPQA